MEITIDIENPVPVFTQLMNQIKHAVSSDVLRPGDPLPSIRQLANDLAVNHKTVAKAYRLLERDAVIQTKGYRGTFVHPNARENSQIDLMNWVTDQIRNIINSCRTAGATDPEIRNAFTTVMNEGFQ